MLLAVDVGNTQTALGLYAGGGLTEHWRLATERSTTADELGVLLGGLLDFDAVEGICLASTVPVLIREWQELARKWADAPLLVVGPGVKTGIPIRYDDPREVGPDRIVNAVAAKERYGAPVIVVDFGTSTNFDVVSPEGEYVGGVLAPGIEISMDALFARAARLVKVDYAVPPAVIGKTTVGGAAVGSRVRVRGSGGRHRRADPRGARCRGARGRDRRARRPRRAALPDDREGRSVPHARRPPDGLGAERVIVDPGTLAVFALASAALVAVPGPAVLYILTRSLHQGRRAGVASVLGIEVGALVHVLAAAVGLSALLASSAVAFSVVKYAGAAYLIALGLWTLLSGRAESEEPLERERRLGRIFAQGILVNVLNPKVALFFLAFLPQFVDPDGAQPALQIVLLGLVFVSIALVLDLVWALSAGTAGLALRRSRRFIRAQRYVSSGVYVALGVGTAFTGSADD